jgi:chromosome segregation ATPase
MLWVYLVSFVEFVLISLQEDLRTSRARIEELEELDSQHQISAETLQKQITELSNERDERAREVADLRNRTNVTQQNWISERDDLVRREALAREEFETAKQAMQDWEVLAMEERSIREGLGDRIAELEDQLDTQQQAYERAASERDDQSGTVDGLQRALQDIQEGM